MTQTIYIGKAAAQEKFNEYLKQVYAKALNKDPSEVLLSDMLNEFPRRR